MVKVDRHGKENRFEPSMRMNLSSFLEVYNETEYYLVDTLPREMWKDFAIPDCLLCGGFTERLQVRACKVPGAPKRKKTLDV